MYTESELSKSEQRRLARNTDNYIISNTQNGHIKSDRHTLKTS